MCERSVLLLEEEEEDEQTIDDNGHAVRCNAVCAGNGSHGGCWVTGSVFPADDACLWSCRIESGRTVTPSSVSARSLTPPKANPNETISAQHNTGRKARVRCPWRPGYYVTPSMTPCAKIYDADLRSDRLSRWHKLRVGSRTVFFPRWKPLPPSKSNFLFSLSSMA